MVWLYRLQQRIAITERECLALLTLVGLFGAGLGMRAVQRASHPPPPTYIQDALPIHAAALGAQPAVSRAPARTAAADSAAAEPVRPEGEAAGPEAPPPAAAPEAVARTPAAAAARVNLNTATAGQLQQLPRIGPKIAERILAYREAHGDFAHVGELVRVKGIGPKTLARLEPLVSVSE